jgi:hypothetical protein
MRKQLQLLLSLAAVISSFSTFGQTRAKVMDNAKAFREYAWVAPKGLSACNTKKIWTPFAEKTSVLGVAYAWGSGHTIPEFANAIKNGGYAGNRCTSSAGNPTYTPGTYGVDCSGLVTRVWERPEKHLGTSQLPAITHPVRGGVDNMRSGDIFNWSSEHTVVYSHRESSGELGVVEASANDWKVSKHTYSLSYFLDKKKKYTPLRYPNLQDAGIAKITSGISAPSSVKKGQSLSVSLRLTETDGESIRYDRITVAVLALNDTFQFDLTHQLNVSIKGDGTYDYKGSGVANLTPGTYKLVARGNIGGTSSGWSDLLVSGSGKNYVAFTVVK